MADNTRDIAIQNQQKLTSVGEDVKELKVMLENIQRNTAFASGELGKKADLDDYSRFKESVVLWQNTWDGRWKLALGVLTFIGGVMTLLINFLWDWWQSR